LEGIENLINLYILHCKNNQLTSSEGIENLIKLTKNKKKILHKLYFDFIDCDDYFELNDLFDNLVKCKKNYSIKYIQEIEQMIKELNGYKKYVLK
jgi:uncharacterized protein YfkK (UPF0435 family)